MKSEKIVPKNLEVKKESTTFASHLKKMLGKFKSEPQRKDG